MAINMVSIQKDPLLQVETTCRPLLSELQSIWDEVGESEADRDKILLELERECLEVYRGKVDQANRSRAQIRQAISDTEAELVAICYAMGERPVHIRQTEHRAGSLKEELSALLPYLEEMRKRKLDRKNHFLDIIEQIQEVSTEIYGSETYDSTEKVVDENDLSLGRLEELQRQLQSLQKEKSDRLKQVMKCLSVLSSLCSVLGLDFKETVREIHPSLADSRETYGPHTHTLESLEASVKRLRELKLQRMQRLQDLATMLLELWNLMDTPVEEQQVFHKVTCNIAASEDEMTEPNMLSEDFIQSVEAGVSRLEKLKSSKMKELVLKKRSELEEICQKTHLVFEADGKTGDVVTAIESGALDPTSVLEQIEMEVAKVKEEAFSRKEILEKVEKWLSACEEEEWLEHYNMDENRYSAGHLTLKRAEKARALVYKIPGMVEALTAKVQNWEDERGVDFMYDGNHLLSMLDDYNVSRQEREQEKKRQREQKKLHGQVGAAQDSKPSLLKSSKKASRMHVGGGNNRGLSAGVNFIQTPKAESSSAAKATSNSRPVKKDDRNGTQSPVRRAQGIVRNYTFNGRESEPTVLGRPCSPISSPSSYRANGDHFDDYDRLQGNSIQKPLSKNETSQEDVTNIASSPP